MNTFGAVQHCSAPAWRSPREDLVDSVKKSEDLVVAQMAVVAKNPESDAALKMVDIAVGILENARASLASYDCGELARNIEADKQNTQRQRDYWHSQTITEPARFRAIADGDTAFANAQYCNAFNAGRWHQQSLWIPQSVQTLDESGKALLSN